MTREERLELLKQIEKDIYVPSIESTFLEDAKSCAIHSVIEELEQEPCDCISRSQALSDYADWYGYGYRDNTFYKHLKSMPSIQTKQKPDRWEIVPKSEFDSSTSEHIRCTNCGKEPFGDIPFSFCPYCGKPKMSENLTCSERKEV